MSRQSIGLFLDSFPNNETEYANQEIFSAVREIINADLGLGKEMKLNEKLCLIIRSHKFHLFFIGLVVLDCLCVAFQMILDIVSRRRRSREAGHDTDPLIHYLELGAESFSLCILSIFLLSILCHAILLKKEYFKSKLEMFDAMIVVVSFILEIWAIVKSDIREVEITVLSFR